MVPRAAIVLFLLALLLAVIAGSVLRSDAGGSIGLLVGWPAAAGALLVGLYALRRWRRDAPTRGRALRRLGAGPRLLLIAIGCFALGMGMYELATGKADPVRGAEVRREQQPGKYWPLVLLHLGGGVVLLALGLRRPSGGRARDEED